ncbi:hypothetical protein BGZ96_002470 [Linnemannia gamsii]|uniref:Uncharacterized protein n=1 Tax=Linnemannia gamsii TaxID=64522 RepID=A0ABQ7K9B8_9FUNG|nr:hypothetical protein BGZ96_002470 [Linnemannia gamsii]
MFARPVDPFFAYNDAFSAAERRHKEMFAQQHISSQQELGPQQPPRLDINQASNPHTHSKRRKHSLHFEPEFLSALDSSLQDPLPVLSRPRPCKKLRCSTTATTTTPNTHNNNNSTAQSRTSPPTAVPETLFPTTTKQRASTSPTTLLPQISTLKTTDGPSIIDLSSGEELIPMNVGQSDHKRPRESLSESSPSSSVESLREVYDVQEDGSLCPVLDHAPALPSPAKRSRIDDEPLKSLEELEQAREHKRQNRRSTTSARRMRATASTNNAINNNMYGYRDEAMMDTAGWMSDDDCHINSNSYQKAERPEMALIRYEGPKTVTLAEGVDALIRKRWNDDHDILSLDNLQGNELVLYRPLPPRALLDNDDNDDELSLAVIEELDNDSNIYQASHTSSDISDDLINELEDKIMDMDLD